MGTVTYYVALAFKRSEDGGGMVGCEPKEARSSDQAIRMASSLGRMEGHCGAIAFSRTGDPACLRHSIRNTIGRVQSRRCFGWRSFRSTEAIAESSRKLARRRAGVNVVSPAFSIRCDPR
jgi:hypothetical protein